jgi:hypothetical protein
MHVEQYQARARGAAVSDARAGHMRPRATRLFVRFSGPYLYVSFLKFELLAVRAVQSICMRMR